VISVAGDYAGLTAFQALGAGLHVLLFSDNVPVGTEIALKAYARSNGLLLMGPGAGTAMPRRTCLGFANVVTPGRVGVVAAAGTGAQEAMCLLDRWGVGRQPGHRSRRARPERAGGRSDGEVKRSPRCATDPGTDAILLVSKPPSRQVARAVLDTAGPTPLIAALIGLDAVGFPVPDGVTLARTLETGVVGALAVLGHSAPDTTGAVRATYRPGAQPARAPPHRGSRTLLRWDAVLRVPWSSSAVCWARCTPTLPSIRRGGCPRRQVATRWP
jgi:FdrA protein